MLRHVNIRVQRVGPIGAILIVLGVMLLFALALMLLIPAMVLGVLFAAALGVRAVARAMLARMRSPNGMLDGRRNVKVVVRE